MSYKVKNYMRLDLYIDVNASAFEALRIMSIGIVTEVISFQRL
ncbi:MAG: hypothetical protein QW743_03630 [Candidatus Methanomethylicia archaeon]